MTLRLNVMTNMSYFLTNYLMIGGLNAVIISLSHPIMMFWCIAVALLWYCHRLTVNYPLPPFLSPHLTPFRRTLLLLVVSLYVFIWYCLMPLLAVAGVTAFVVVGHAAGRNSADIKAVISHDKDTKGGKDDKGMIDDD
eukprot:CAMPEP_0118637978 /NCGR_PEP_ID=MMETSP0785-20121206/3439_1 /TAXON_ID=91992 /ORGANISM="Bolidomonas pacifica, Strain CCMP 1866" /LENGTH=137 /DNA_ID=CAMNT_0006529197 /DNA_START=304 /DNA_END=715 /DNA_ORIENTATION=+